MKPMEQVLDSIYKFTQTQKNTLDLIINQLNSIKDKQISIETFNSLNNSFRELDGLRENVMVRLLASMKRGDILT